MPVTMRQLAFYTICSSGSLLRIWTYKQQLLCDWARMARSGLETKYHVHIDDWDLIDLIENLTISNLLLFVFGFLCLGKNICSEPLIPQPFEPLSCLLIIHFPTFLLHLRFLCYLDQHLLSTIAYIPAAAYKELRTSLEQVDNLFSVMIKAVLDILAALRLFRGTRKRKAERYRTELLPALE